MIVKKRRLLFDVLIILLLGLIPLLWFKGDTIILGHDAGLTLAPQGHFLDRLFTWTERFGFGNDQTYAIPGFFIHGLEACISWLGFSVQNVQKITFSFWFVLPGLMMYLFASRIEKKYKLQYFALPVAVLYMINHYLLQGWFVAERTKFSVYAAAPLLLLLLFDWKEGNRTTLRTAIYLSLTFFFLNGLASLPLFGGVLLILLVFGFVFFLEGLSVKKIKAALVLLLYTGIFSILLQAYWLLPYGQHVKNSYATSVEFFGGVDGIVNWVKYVSENSSYTNLFRLQGVPEWYQNPNHPYSHPYLTNPLLIAISFLLPIAAFLPLYFYKDKKLRKVILFFSALTLLSFIFTAGSHPPFGFLYLLMVQYIPGFIAFRTPFYKFASALWLGYAVLTGFTVSYYLTMLAKKSKKVHRFVYGLLLAGIVVYSYPFLTGSFFDYMGTTRTMRVSVPGYVYEYGKWSETPERITRRTLVLPQPNPVANVEAYTWGYWSLAPVSSLLTNAPIINRTMYMTKDEQQLITALYEMMKRGDSQWIEMAKLLGIESFLLRNDFAWNLPDSPTDSPEVYKKVLAQDTVLVKEFGKWQVYDIKNADANDVQGFSHITYAEAVPNDLTKIVSLPDFTYAQPLVVSSQNNDAELTPAINQYYLSATCAMCNLQWKFIHRDAYIPLLTRGSIFYPLIANNEKNQEEKAKKQQPTTVRYYAYKSLRDLLGYQKQIDERREETLIYETGKDFDQSLQKLQQNLPGISSTRSISDNELLIEVLSVLRLVRVSFNEINARLDGYENIEQRKRMLSDSAKHVRNLESTRKHIETLVWRSNTDSEKHFLVNAREEGVYEVYYRTNDASVDTDQPMTLIKGDETYLIQEKVNDSDWYSLGEITLQKGVNRVKTLQQTKNLHEETEVISIGGESSSCYTSRIFPSQENDIFSISFDHRKLTKDGTFFIKMLPAGRDLMSGEFVETLRSVDDQRFYENIYASSSNDGFTVLLCNRGTADEAEGTSLIEIENFVVKKIAVPDLLFRKGNVQKNQTNPINYTRLNQTEYRVEFDHKNKNNFLTLNGSFNNGWLLDQCKGEHTVVNGFMNGWFLKQIPETCTIQYTSQQLLQSGFIISGVTFLSLVSYLGFTYGKEKRKMS